MIPLEAFRPVLIASRCVVPTHGQGAHVLLSVIALGGLESAENAAVSVKAALWPIVIALPCVATTRDREFSGGFQAG